MKQLLHTVYLLIMSKGWQKKFLLYFLFIIPICYLNYFTFFSVAQTAKKSSAATGFLLYAFLFLAAISYGFFIEYLFAPSLKKQLQKTGWLLVAAPVIFSFKVIFPSGVLNAVFFHNRFSGGWAMPLYWCTNAVWVVLLLGIFYRFTEKKWGLYGLKNSRQVHLYFLLVLLMVPLLLAASQQSSFQAVYPKAGLLTNVSPVNIFLFETSYAIDLFTIELFFRGFLITVLSKALGRYCIFPIALFYFSIHLGKPMFEAISSFFGGLILGSIAYKSKSIWGGWIVHVGIAMLMELFGFLF